MKRLTYREAFFYIFYFHSNIIEKTFVNIFKPFINEKTKRL